LVARTHGVREAAGSSPVTPTKYKMNEEFEPFFNITNFEEPTGNFVRIFPELGLTREEVRERIELTGTSKSVKPLEYFKDVGNGMNPNTQLIENNKVIPEEITDPIQRAQIALEYLSNGNHIGVDEEQYERDLQSGKNHDDTMRFFLEKILSGQKLEPCVIVITKQAETKFGKGISKVILDGTHRATIASLVNIELEVVEFTID
jgi:hypothetical protein